MRSSRIDWTPLYAAAGGARVQPDAGRRALARAQRLIEAEYADSLTLDRLASEAGYSPAHFLRRYAAVYGDTPLRSLTTRRMLAARHLLETTQLSVTEICFAVGFSSLGSFSHRFHQQFGQPPSAWRRRFWYVGAAAQMASRIPSCFWARYADSSELASLA